MALQPLKQVLRRCLSDDSRERFPSAAALREELIPLLSACPPLELAGEQAPA